MPSFESKITPLLGDIMKVNFDLSTDDERLLIENCHVIINSGASIRFTEPLL